MVDLRGKAGRGKRDQRPVVEHRTKWNTKQCYLSTHHTPDFVFCVGFSFNSHSATKQSENPTPTHRRPKEKAAPGHQEHRAQPGGHAGPAHPLLLIMAFAPGEFKHVWKPEPPLGSFCWLSSKGKTSQEENHRCQ